MSVISSRLLLPNARSPRNVPSLECPVTVEGITKSPVLRLPSPSLKLTVRSPKRVCAGPELTMEPDDDDVGDGWGDGALVCGRGEGAAAAAASAAANQGPVPPAITHIIIVR